MLDHDDDGVEDTIDGTTAIADAIDSACELIDARIGKVYATPFAGIGDSPATPALVTRIANMLTLWELYSEVDPESPEAKSWFSRADALLNGLLDESLHLDAAKVAVETRRPVVHESAGTFAAGRVGGDYSTRGVNKLRGA